MEGYIKIYRRIAEWEWHDSPNTGWLFVMLLVLANHEDVKWHGMDIRRGQLVTSLQKLTEVTGISVRSIRTGLERLEATGEITSQATNKYRIITICKYDSYQGEKIDADKQLTSKRQTNDNQTTTNNNDNNDNNIISSTTARVKVDDISVWFRGIAGTSQMESVRKEIYRLTGSVPDTMAMDELVARWMDELKIQGVGWKDAGDICSHFVSWARIAIPAEARRNNSKNMIITKNTKDDERYLIRLPNEFKPLM